MSPQTTYTDRPGRGRTAITLAAVVLATVVLAGCVAPAASPAAPAAGGPFPVVIEHAFGTTTVPAAPERVVALGPNDVALAVALDAPLVGAIRNFTGTDPDLPYLDPLPDEVLGLDYNSPISVEAVAAYRPDLILATSSYQVTPDVYADLSNLAPVVPYETSLYGSSIDQDALLVGRALGNEPGARRLVDEADAALDAVRAELPGLAGRSYLFGQARGEVLPMVVGAENLSTQLMNDLGLRVPDGFLDAPVSDSLAPGTVGLSYEEAGRLDEADALFMTFATPEDRTVFESSPLVAPLSVLREGRYQALTTDTAVALQAPNVVAVEWLLEQLRPTLETIGR